MNNYQNKQIQTTKKIQETKKSDNVLIQENTKTFEYGLTFPCNESPNLFISNLKFRLEHYGCVELLNKDDFTL